MALVAFVLPAMLMASQSQCLLSPLSRLSGNCMKPMTAVLATIVKTGIRQFCLVKDHSGHAEPGEIEQRLGLVQFKPNIFEKDGLEQDRSQCFLNLPYDRSFWMVFDER